MITIVLKCASRRVRSLFQRKFSREFEPVLLVSVSSVFSFPLNIPFAAYIFFHFFCSFYLALNNVFQKAVPAQDATNLVSFLSFFLCYAWLSFPPWLYVILVLLYFKLYTRCFRRNSKYFRRWQYGLFRVNKFIKTCVQFSVGCADTAFWMLRIKCLKKVWRKDKWRIDCIYWLCKWSQ